MKELDRLQVLTRIAERRLTRRRAAGLLQIGERRCTTPRSVALRSRRSTRLAPAADVNLTARAGIATVRMRWRLAHPPTEPRFASGDSRGRAHGKTNFLFPRFRSAMVAVEHRSPTRTVVVNVGWA